MSERNKWLLKTDTNVKIYAPTSTEGKGKYYRIAYRDKGKYWHTTATSEVAARREAARIHKKIKAGGYLRSELKGSDFIAAYLDPAVRGISGNAWGPKHTQSQESLIKLYIRPVIGEIPCTEITNTHLIEIVNSGTSLSTRDHLRRAIGAMVRWGKAEKWITEEPEDLLKGLKNVAKNLGGVVKATQSGESNLFVDPAEIPSHLDVAAVAQAASKISGIWWHELMFNLAAYSGARLGEMVDLDISHIDLDRKTIRIEMQCLEAGGKKSRQLPKMAKQRTTVYPTVTPAGYPLAEMMVKRIQELQELEEAPKLLDGSRRLLLFPNKRALGCHRARSQEISAGQRRS